MVVSELGFSVLTNERNSYAGELSSNFVMVEINQLRDIKNSEEKLQLFDSKGVEMNSVQYRDYNLWPCEAYGVGKSLKLFNLEIDNSFVSSWVASTIFEVALELIIVSDKLAYQVLNVIIS